MNTARRAWCLVLLTLLLNGCSGVFYHPSRDVYMDPARLGLLFNDVEFLSRDGTRLHGWYFPPAPRKGLKPKGTIVQFHGNSENITTHFSLLHWAIPEGYGLFVFDYRGYGASAGNPNAVGIDLDARAAIEWAFDHGIRPRGAKGQDLVLIGHSLGGAILMRSFVELKRERPEIARATRAVVIDSSFYSYRSEAAALISTRWWMAWMQPFAWLSVSDERSPADMIAEISPTPLLVIHGTADNVTPIRMGRGIFERAREPRTLWEIPDGQHIDAFQRTEGMSYRKRLLDFLDALPEASASKS